MMIGLIRLYGLGWYMGEWNNMFVVRKDFYKIVVFILWLRCERGGYWCMCSRVYLGSFMYVFVILYCWFMCNDSVFKEGYVWSWVVRMMDKWWMLRCYI